MIPDTVFIGFDRRTVPGMKIRGNLLRTHDPDILRKACIQGKGKLLSRDPGRGVKYRYISQGMNPGIRSGSPDHLDLLSGQMSDLPVQNLLDGYPVGLQLPAAVVCSVVSYDQSYPFFPDRYGFFLLRLVCHVTSPSCPLGHFLPLLHKKSSCPGTFSPPAAPKEAASGRSFLPHRG